MKRSALIVAAAALMPAAASAGGFDTPMLYSARHMGMGGTAIGYVDDPSALFHNPAGLGHIRRFTALGDFSLLLGHVRATPSPLAEDQESELTVAPMFLLGAGLRLNDWITIGAGIYPNASAGATYKYQVAPPAETENKTRIVFVEASPAISFNLPGRVRLGAGYRVTYVSLERFAGIRGDAQNPPVLDFEMTGFDFAGFRVGAQWTALDWLNVGAVYRHKTSTTVTNDTGIALAQQFTDIETTFVLPSKLGLGTRADFGPVGAAVDFEYLWNSQNTAFPLKGSAGGMPVSVSNVYRWKDAPTIRGGLEYRLLPGNEPRGRLALRAGYIYDGETTNPQYPSPFGTPPAATQILTAGAGWNGGRWQVNLAYGYRFGEGDVTTADLMAEGREMCQFCGFAGKKPYRLTLNGLYIDFSFSL